MSTIVYIDALEVVASVPFRTSRPELIDYAQLDNDMLLKLTRSGAESLRDALTEALQGSAS